MNPNPRGWAYIYVLATLSERFCGPRLWQVCLRGDFELTAVEWGSRRRRRNKAQASSAFARKDRKVRTPKKRLSLNTWKGCWTRRAARRRGPLFQSDRCPSRRLCRCARYLSFNDERVDLHGQFRMDTKFSKAASGLAPFHSHYGSAGGKVEG